MATLAFLHGPCGRAWDCHLVVPRYLWLAIWIKLPHMIVPAIPLICLRVADLVGPICGPYCLLSVLAMIGVMGYRRNEYSGGSAIASH